MLKKVLLFIIILLLIIPLSSCSIFTNSKPNNFYYTNLLARDVSTEAKIVITIIDTNYYTQNTFSKDDRLTLTNFIKSLKPNNFISKPSSLPAKALYKIFITAGQSKYVINVFNEKYISIYPWDGEYDMDYIDMTGIYENYNIYNLCKFIYTLKNKN